MNQPDPPRLRLGNDALAAALRAEVDATARLPVSGVRERLLAAIAARELPATLLATQITPALVVTAVLVASALVGAGIVADRVWLSATSEPSPPIESLAATTAIPTTSTTTSTTPPTTPPTTPLTPLTPLTPTTPTTTPPTPPTPPTKRSPTPSSTPDAGAPRTLDVELRQFERGQGAFEEGRPAIAVRELRAYLEAHPQGRLRVEARQILVEALLQAGRADDALDELALASASERGAPAMRSAELAALVSLGRCDDARKIAERMVPANDVVDARLAAFHARCGDR